MRPASISENDLARLLAASKKQVIETYARIKDREWEAGREWGDRTEIDEELGREYAAIVFDRLEQEQEQEQRNG